MVGILQNQYLTKERLEEIENWHWEKVYDLLKHTKVELKYQRKTSNIEKDLVPYTIKDIVTASYSKLQTFASKLPHSILNKYVLKGRTKHLFVHIYDNYRRRYGAELVKKLQISVCPYCNRNYINSNGSKTPAQFDHFFNKDSYPILALSLYNLIPCCPTCNQWKGTKSFDISPFDKQYLTDEIIQFSFIPQDVDSYTIQTKALNPKMQTNINNLQLNDRYSAHIDLLKELIFKQKIYCKRYLSSLENYMNQIGIPISMSPKEVIYGNYMTQDKYYLRPLSKFTHDIIEELEKC